MVDVRLCSRCGQPARDSDLECLKCGHAFRVGLGPDPVRSASYAYPAPSSPHAPYHVPGRIAVPRRVSGGVLILLGAIAVASLGMWIGSRRGVAEWRPSQPTFQEYLRQNPPRWAAGPTVRPAAAARPTAQQLNSIAQASHCPEDLVQRIGPPAEEHMEGTTTVQTFNASDGQFVMHWRPAP